MYCTGWKAWCQAGRKIYSGDRKRGPCGDALVVPGRPGVLPALRNGPPVQGEVADDAFDVGVVQVRRPVADAVEPRGLDHVILAVAGPCVRGGLPTALVVLDHRPPRVERRERELNDDQVVGVTEADEGDGRGVVGGGHGCIVLGGGRGVKREERFSDYSPGTPPGCRPTGHPQRRTNGCPRQRGRSRRAGPR